MRCSSFCTADSYKLLAINSAFKFKGYAVTQYRKVLHLIPPNRKGDIFIFSYGCIVIWGLTNAEEKALLQQIKLFSIKPLSNIEKDQFIFRYSDATEMTTHDRFNADIITIESDNVQILLAISYGLAQSIQLESYESAIQKTIDENSHFSEDLATHGNIKLSQKEIAKRMGELFIARTYINLNSEFLADPEYFWEHTSLEAYYSMSKKFLDIPRRVSALNQKLDVLHGLFEMLTTQSQHKHSSHLEVIIILLIFIEITISLIQFKF
jgi:uncharacterized Rmd1/YagE family protein